MARKVMSKSTVAKAAAAGTDLGKPGKGFQKGVSSLQGKYGKGRAEKIMGAQLQKMRAKGQL